MDSTAQQLIGFGILAFLGWAGLALVIYVNNKYGDNGK